MNEQTILDAIAAEPSANLLQANDHYVYFRAHLIVAQRIAKVARAFIFRAPDSRRDSMYYVNLDWLYDGEGEVVQCDQIG